MNSIKALEDLLAGKAPEKETITQRIGSYVMMIGRMCPDGTHVSLEMRRKYARVSVNERVHSFVNLKTGDILKAGTHAGPAENGVRGSIWSDDLGESVINQYGTKYLK